MKLPYFGQKFVARLRADAEANVTQYNEGGSWSEDFAGTERFRYDTERVVDPPPQLIRSTDARFTVDAENARRVYSWLESLPPTLAMEERLWACLAHTVFADYMRDRWPVTNASTVRRRYLFEGKSFAALSRHGIARLWWAGHLTKDSVRANPFELTETLFLRQDIQVALLERAIGKSRTVRVAVLDYLRINQTKLSSAAFSRRVQLLVRELNLLGAVVILDTLPLTSLSSLVESVGNRLIDESGSDEIEL